MTTDEPINAVDSELVCPGCRRLLIKASAVLEDEQKHPKAGDFSLCCECGCIMRFDNPGLAHIATYGDLVEAGPAVALGLVMAQRELQEVIGRKDQS